MPARIDRSWGVLLVGVALPALCLGLDPVVFQGSSLGVREGLVPQLRCAAFAFCAVEWVALLVWTMRRRSCSPVLSRVLGGAMVTGAVAAFAAGVLLVPISALGVLVFGLGLLGLTPFAVGLVYAAEGMRALSAPGEGVRPAIARAGLIAGLLLPIAFSAGVDAWTDFAVEARISAVSVGDAPAIGAGVPVWLRGSDDLVRRYHVARHVAPSPERARAIAAIYARVTGAPIEARHRVLFD